MFAEFEVLFAQLLHHTPQSIEHLSALKAKLNDLAHSYSGAPIDSGDYLMNRECLSAIKSLRTNDDILITKPDKGSGVVVLQKANYIRKMELILQDNTKFKFIGPVKHHDNTAKLESKIQRRLLQLKKDELLPPSIYESIRPSGSQRPRMYGLPKTHKKDVPLRPILSMTGSAQHSLAKWPSTIFNPVIKLYSSNCIQDSFTFAKTIRHFNLPPSSFLCSFDISSLFTNVPLNETIQICADVLYDSELTAPCFPRDVFVDLMHMATSSVEFSFNDLIYQQVDGVAMGSPLGPALANIFVGFYELLLFDKVKKPLLYFRYVDDTFAIFHCESDCNTFLRELNNLHPSLKFTFEKELNDSLAFLDVSVERLDYKLIRSVFRKPTFTGHYLKWNSFSPAKRKINLISTLVHRALMICSKSKLNAELDNIFSILISNGSE